MDSRIVPTEKEYDILASAKRNGIALFACAIAFCSLVFAREYRPVTTTLQTRAFNTAYQPSVGQNTLVIFSQSTIAALTLSGGAVGTITFQTSPTSGGTYTTQGTVSNGSTGAVVVGIATNNQQGNQIIDVVPAGYYYKIVTANTTGTPTFAALQVQETQF